MVFLAEHFGCYYKACNTKGISICTASDKILYRVTVTEKNIKNKMFIIVPPPKGAQITRLMALTQSSMSFWELAISRKASWLRADLSFSPVPPKQSETERQIKNKCTCFVAWLFCVLLHMTVCQYSRVIVPSFFQKFL